MSSTAAAKMRAKTPPPPSGCGARASRRPLPTLEERFGLTGAVICAVDLIRGIGLYAGLTSILVPGATGYLDTNYQGKVDAALAALHERDLAFVHVEAPDEAGHKGELKLKLQAIEDFDAKVVGPLLQGLRGSATTGCW